MEQELTKRMSEYLLSLREGAKLSQQDVAARSNFIGTTCHLDQRAVSRLEKDPLNATAINIAAYMNALGRKEKEFYKKIKEITSRLGATTMSQILETQSKSQIAEHIESALGRVTSALTILTEHSGTYLKELNLESRLLSAIENLKGLYRKPVIGVFGHYDVGKTTVLNTILDSRLLPESYQPATSIVNLIIHEDDKPAVLGGCNVAVFRKGFLPHMVNDKAEVDQHLIKMGDYSLLEELGIHDYDEGTNDEAYIAMVFSKAEILKKVWLLDTPGHLNEEETGDTEKALAGVELVDGLLFVSCFNGFFDSKDFAFFSDILRHREPATSDGKLEHVAIIASHCHNSITESDIARAKSNAYKRLRKQMDEFIFEPWLNEEKVKEKPSSLDLEARTLPFWRETPEYKNALISEIATMSNHLSYNHCKLVENAISRLDEQLVKVLTNAKLELLSKKQGVEERVKELDEQESKFRSESAEIVARFEKLISTCSSRKNEDIERVLNYYNAHMSAEGLANMVRTTFDDKKAAEESIGALVGQKLNNKVEQTLRASSDSMTNEIDLLLSQWDKSTPNMTKMIGDCSGAEGIAGGSFSAFDSRAAFIGGMSGLTSLGAMSFYVSTYITSNLGAYILVARVAGWLTRLGITSSVTTTTSFVAALGGPITVGIALASALGYGFYRLVGRDWQASFGKKVRDALAKEGTEDKLKDPVEKFWNSTNQAIREGVKGLIQDTEDYIVKLRSEATTEYDIVKLDECIAVVEELRGKFIK